MQYDLIHIVPFDIGLALSKTDSSKRYQPCQFLSDLEYYAHNKGCTFVKQSEPCLCSIVLSEQLECFLFSFGVGVFVFRNSNRSLLQQHNECGILQPHIACGAYYDKKKFQERINYDSVGLDEKASDLMTEIWRLKDQSSSSVRPYSSTRRYKRNGLSYELTIYHIHGLEFTADEEQEIDILLNPMLITDILDEAKWKEIAASLANRQKIGFDSCDYGANSKVAATWAAVAVLEKEQTDLVEAVIRYETLLQCGWFFYDATIDNLENEDFDGVELQRLKNASTEVDHYVSCGISANMNTRTRSAKQLVYRTSGYEDIRDRCRNLLDDRISLEKARHEKGQAFYGMLTEILLVVFTLFQIYEPIKNLVSGQLSYNDMVVLVVIILLLVVSIIFIVKRSR